MKKRLALLLAVCLMLTPIASMETPDEPLFEVIEESDYNVVSDDLDESVEEIEEFSLDGLYEENDEEDFSLPDGLTIADETGDTPVESNATDVALDANHFPDPNFLKYLKDQKFDADGNGVLSASEIAGVQSINTWGINISSLSGIEYFTNLSKLYCPNQLTSLDVSRNAALTDLNCSYNQLTSLDVSKNTALTDLNCSGNQLTSLDVSRNAALTDLNCSYNQLTSLDVSRNTALTYLVCVGIQLTSLDVSRNTALSYLQCSDNQLTSLDVSRNTALTDLDCSGNQLTSLDVTKNTILEYLICDHNLLTSLNVSNNTLLDGLDCSFNHLTSLDVTKNTVLEGFDGYFNCSYNQLTSLDVSNNTLLIDLDCSNNQLENLILNKRIMHLICYNNKLSILDISNCSFLTDAYHFGWKEKNDDYNCIEYVYEDELNEYSDFYVDDIPIYTGLSPNYGWNFEKDSFSFYNKKSIFNGNAPYHIEPEHFNYLLSRLTPVNRMICAMSHGQGEFGSVEQYVNFLNNKLDNWNGACYGMSLVAALFKEGIQNPSSFGGSTTFSIPFNPIIESWVNMYYLSQCFAFTLFLEKEVNINDERFPEFINNLYKKAQKIKTGEQEIFLISLHGKGGGHSIACIGATEIQSRTDDDGITYDHAILTYDPNTKYRTGILISNDSRHVLCSQTFDEFYYSIDTFGYTDDSLLDLSTIGGQNTLHQALLIGSSAFSGIIRSATGAVEFINGQIVGISGHLKAKKIPFFRGDGNDDTVMYYFDDSSSSYTIESNNASSTVNADLIVDNLSIGINGAMKSTTIGRDGSVKLNGASGDVSVSLVKNDASFDYATVAGQANGDVNLSFDGSALYVNGMTSDYTVTNVKTDASQSQMKVPGGGNTKTVMEENEVSVYKDTDGDGSYETHVGSEDDPTPTPTPEPTPTSEPTPTPEPTPETVVLDKKTVKKSVEVGKKLRITVPGQTITDYKSSKTKVADVSTDGLVTLLNEGKANITATDSAKKKYKLSLTVVDPFKPKKIIFKQKGTVTVDARSPFRVEYALDPSTAKTDILWKSSNTKIATVADGVVTPLNIGNVTITATTVKGKKSAKLKLKLVDPTIPTKIALAPKGTVKLGLGETVQLTCQLTPSTAETDIEWKSSNESVATVNNGLVTPLKAGKVTITATTVKGKKSAKVKIKIK